MVPRLIPICRWLRSNLPLRAETAAADKKTVVIIAGIGIIVSLGSLYYTQMRSPNRVNLEPFIGIGQVVADETARALGDHGRVMLLVSDLRRDPHSLEQPQRDGFLREIANHHQIRVVATETVRAVAPPIEDATRDLGLTNEQFAELLEKHNDADAVVALIELPAFNPAQPLKLPRVHPKIIAAQMPLQSGQAYLRDKTIVAFIAKREESSAAAPTKPRTPREWFHRYFQVITVADRAAQPPVSEARQ